VIHALRIGMAARLFRVVSRVHADLGFPDLHPMPRNHASFLESSCMLIDGVIRQIKTFAR